MLSATASTRCWRAASESALTVPASGAAESAPRQLASLPNGIASLQAPSELCVTLSADDAVIDARCALVGTARGIGSPCVTEMEGVGA
jgi:hypothetical protein